MGGRNMAISGTINITPREHGSRPTHFQFSIRKMATDNLNEHPDDTDGYLQWSLPKHGLANKSIAA
jgi:hypothetical protein